MIHKGPFLGLTIGSRWKGAAGEGWAGAEPRGGGVLSRVWEGSGPPFMPLPHAGTAHHHHPGQCPLLWRSPGAESMVRIIPGPT